MAKRDTLDVGDLVYRKDREQDLFIVIGHTYRVSRWANRRLMKLFCISTGQTEYVLEEQLVVINPANSKKSS